MELNWWIIGSVVFVVFVIVKVISVRSFLQWWKRRQANDTVIHDDQE